MSSALDLIQKHYYCFKFGKKKRLKTRSEFLNRISKSYPYTYHERECPMEDVHRTDKAPKEPTQSIEGFEHQKSVASISRDCTCGSKMMEWKNDSNFKTKSISSQKVIKAKCNCAN
ncbi:hypothetical protein Tsp_03234 [Trichinella spiralis]|uniref:hypothetical protein n=1 Tax=Trichinella spiralis TaxID=6334 RepID=UPI0001EFC1BD|nr:hypothetical protein Tsp_03234 [Trichinella spiralis]